MTGGRRLSSIGFQHGENIRFERLRGSLQWLKRLPQIAIIAVHIVAAIYHHVVAKDDSTARMLRFWRSEKASNP